MVTLVRRPLTARNARRLFRKMITAAARPRCLRYTYRRYVSAQ